MPTKIDLIARAYAEIGLGPAAQDLTPQERADGLARMDALLAEWAGRGANIGYAPGGELTDDAGIPIDLHRGVVASLAVDLAPGFGRQPRPETLTAAQQGRNLAFKKSVVVVERRMDIVPAGAGNKRTVALSQTDNEVTPDERHG